MMFVLRPGLMAFACVPLLLVGACGDDTPKSDGPSTPAPSVSTSSSPSPSESESVLPEDQPASEVTPEEFAKLWVALYSQTAVSGDTSRLRELSQSSCDLCQLLADDIDAIYSAGGSIQPTGESQTVLSTVPAEKTERQFTRVELRVRSAQSEVILKAGQPSQTFEEVTRRWTFELEESKGHWTVYQAVAK